ncbi:MULTISPECIES: hypothetical protein [Achromobacter]|uniref:Secreted protein n=1 Tax=Achromobacter xylosoxidans (strain A8) TaxID=762376 RepID=E3HY74_ACHXA|nr:hypothetical protein [Achromobacter xylosoxidans]ADP20028.1 hypothetical protein AXYL_06744 [Achromobacter xylosoxidans A8]
MKATFDATKLIIAALGALASSPPAVASSDLAIPTVAMHVQYTGAPVGNATAEAALPSLRTWSGTLSVPLHGHAYTSEHISHVYLFECSAEFIEQSKVNLGLQLSIASVNANESFMTFEVKTKVQTVHSIDVATSPDCVLGPGAEVLRPVVGTRAATVRLELARDGTPATVPLLDGSVMQMAIINALAATERADLPMEASF